MATRKKKSPTAPRINPAQVIFAELESMTREEQEMTARYLKNWLMENGLY